jgi:hypothetical protein
VRRLGLVVSLVLTAADGACGSVGDRADAAAAVAVRMLDTASGGDGASACALLAPATVAELERSADVACAEAIVRQNLPAPGTVTDRAVYGQWAQIHLSDDTVFLGMFPGGWRVVAAGCTADGDRPYRCTLQGD